MEIFKYKTKSKISSKPRLIGFLVFILLLALISVFTFQVYKKNIDINKSVTKQKLTAIRTQIENSIIATEVVLKQLQASLYFHPNINQNEFDTLVKSIVQSKLSIRHVAIAPNLIIKFIFPLKGNEKAIGLNYIKSKQQYPAVSRAMKSNKINLSGPVNLVQGGTALIFRVPIRTINNTREGLLAAVVSIDLLLKNSGAYSLEKETLLGIRGSDGFGMQGKMVWGTEKAFNKDSIRMKINLPYGHWIISADIDSSFIVGGIQFYTLPLFGLLISTAISYLIYRLLITQRRLKKTLKENIKHANSDALTGLNNRFLFNHKLGEIILLCKRYKRTFSILFIDLDNFKDTNDNKGHISGDHILKVVGQRLTANTRESDIVARVGGDEFAIILPEINSTEQIVTLINKLCHEMDKPIQLNSQIFNISMSIGIATYPDDGLSSDDLLSRADRAMYEAKSTTGSSFVFSNTRLRKESEINKVLLIDLLQSIDDKQFEVHYQPILDSRTKEVVMCEALVRWYHSDGHLRMPGEFINFAENKGLIHKMDKIVLNKASNDWHFFKKNNIDLKMTINFSSKEFSIKDVDKDWINTIKNNNVCPSKFIFEITESVFMEGNEEQLRILNNLRSAGICLAIDDFCTGYSALSYLKMYPTDFVKIDKSFIDKIYADFQAKEIVRALLNIAKTLNIEVIAEGIEEERQFQILKDVRCEYVQGYLFSKPLSRDKLLTWIRNNRELKGD